MSPGPPQQCDLAVVGGGILGLAVARELTRRRPGSERDRAGGRARGGHRPDGHQQRRDPRRDLLRARLARRRSCAWRARARCTPTARRTRSTHERCGKLIVARHDGELAALDELERRGRANEVPGLRRLTADELREVEPHCVGTAALLSPATGIVDFAQVARSLAAELEGAGVPVVTSCAVDGDGAAPGPRGARARARGHRGALRRGLRGRRRRPPGARGGGARRPAHRALPRRLPLPAARAPLARARPDLPGARPVAALPRRAPQPPHRRPGLARPHRAARPARGGRPHLAGHAPDGPALVAHRGVRAAPRAQPALAGRRRGAVRARAAPRATSTAASRASARRRSAATGGWWTTSWCRRPSAPCTCETRPRRRPPRPSRWRG